MEKERGREKRKSRRLQAYEMQHLMMVMGCGRVFTFVYVVYKSENGFIMLSLLQQGQL